MKNYTPADLNSSAYPLKAMEEAIAQINLDSLSPYMQSLLEKQESSTPVRVFPMRKPYMQHNAIDNRQPKVKVV